MPNSTSSPELFTTTCPLDCPDACKLAVTLQSDRVAKIDGATDDPYTDGTICGKVRGYANHVYSPQRVRTPLRRSGPKGSGEFYPISWDKALTEIIDRIKHDRDQHGAESILPLCFGGSNGKLTQDAIDARFFYRLAASRLDRTVCAAPSTAAYSGLYGQMPGVSCLDYATSRLIVVWGNNPHASGIHLVAQVRKAQKQGAKLVVIDPRRTPFASQADLHLRVYPGTDLVVALAMTRWLSEEGFADLDFLAEHTNGFEQLLDRAQQWTMAKAASVAHVPVAMLEEFFRLYAETEPAVIRCGWGPERNRNGGSAIAAILAIPAVANKFARSGGFTMSNSGAWRLDQSRVIQAEAPQTRRINMNRVGDALLSRDDLPITTLFVYNCNPVATLPEQNKVLRGLQRDDLFTIVFDQVMTDTVRYADIVLPATTFLEHDDLRNGYGNTRMGRVTPLVEPFGESRDNNQVFAELLDRMGLSQPDDLTTASQLGEALLGADSHQKLLAEGELTAEAGPHPIQLRDIQPATRSGKIELFPEHLDAASEKGLYCYIGAADGSAPYPLALISPSTTQTVNSSLGYLVNKRAVATLHPVDAAQRSIQSGQAIRLFNSCGEVIVDAKVDESVAPGVVCLPKGLWMRHAKNMRTANALAPDTLTDIGAGACFNDARVEVALA